MVVDHLDLLGVAVLPHETDPVLIVDPDAVLPTTVPSERLEVVARERAQVVEALRGVELDQLALSDPGNAAEPSRRIPMEEGFGISIPEGPDHLPRVLRSALYVKREGASVRELRPLSGPAITGVPRVARAAQRRRVRIV